MRAAAIATGEEGRRRDRERGGEQEQRVTGVKGQCLISSSFDGDRKEDRVRVWDYKKVCISDVSLIEESDAKGREEWEDEQEEVKRENDSDRSSSLSLSFTAS